MKLAEFLRALCISMALGSCLVAAPAFAQCAVPSVITNGEVADATEVMENFDAIAACTAGKINQSGIPDAGSIAVFTDEESITSGDLTGDVSTSGNTATTLAPSGVAAGTYVNATVTVDAKGRVTSASDGVIGSGGTSWVLISSWDGAVDPPIAELDVINLGSSNELMFIIQRVGVSSSEFRRVRVSTDNGASFYNASGDYLQINSSGNATNRDSLARTGTASAVANSLSGVIQNLKGPVKLAEVGGEFNRVHFIGSTADINAIRINADGANMTSGAIYVYVR